jgi:hypothetical protein
MGHSASRLEKAMMRPAIRHRVVGLLVAIAFLVAAWLESRFSSRSQID